MTSPLDLALVTLEKRIKAVEVGLGRQAASEIPAYSDLAFVTKSNIFTQTQTIQGGLNVGSATGAGAGQFFIKMDTSGYPVKIETTSAGSPGIQLWDGAATQNKWLIASGKDNGTDGKLIIYDQRQNKFGLIIDTSQNVGIGQFGSNTIGNQLELYKVTSPAMNITRDNGAGGKNQTLQIGIDGAASRAYIDSTHYSSGGYQLDLRCRGVTLLSIAPSSIGFLGTAPVTARASGGTLAGVIAGLVALGLFSS